MAGIAAGIIHKRVSENENIWNFLQANGRDQTKLIRIPINDSYDLCLCKTVFNSELSHNYSNVIIPSVDIDQYRIYLLTDGLQNNVNEYDVLDRIIDTEFYDNLTLQNDIGILFHQDTNFSLKVSLFNHLNQMVTRYIHDYCKSDFAYIMVIVDTTQPCDITWLSNSTYTLAIMARTTQEGGNQFVIANTMSSKFFFTYLQNAMEPLAILEPLYITERVHRPNSKEGFKRLIHYHSIIGKPQAMKYAIATSGGVDSLVILKTVAYCIAALSDIYKLDLRAIYVDYGQPYSRHRLKCLENEVKRLNNSLRLIKHDYKVELDIVYAQEQTLLPQIPVLDQSWGIIRLLSHIKNHIDNQIVDHGDSVHVAFGSNHSDQHVYSHALNYRLQQAIAALIKNDSPKDKVATYSSGCFFISATLAEILLLNHILEVLLFNNYTPQLFYFDSDSYFVYPNSFDPCFSSVRCGFDPNLFTVQRLDNNKTLLIPRQDLANNIELVRLQYNLCKGCASYLVAVKHYYDLLNQGWIFVESRLKTIVDYLVWYERMRGVLQSGIKIALRRLRETQCHFEGGVK